MAATVRLITYRSLSAPRFLPRSSSLVCFSRCNCVHAPTSPPQSAALPSYTADGASLRRLSLFSHLDRSFFTAGPSAAKQHRQLHTQSQFAVDSVTHLIHHSFEWSSFLESLSAAGYFNSGSDFSAAGDFVPHFPHEFLVPASACLGFARKRPNFLGLLTRSDIEVVVRNWMPFLFKNGEESARKMRLYLNSGLHHLLGTDKPSTVDLMKFILSYVCGVSCSALTNVCNRELVESSLRNLLSELTKLSHGIPDSTLSRSMPNLSAYGQADQSFGQNIEMKRGDWNCPRCNFMNFARNVKCLECEESRPNRQLNPGEWECPECDFFNFRRNTLCSRCDCKRPDENISPRLVRSISSSGGSSLSDVTHSTNSNLEKKLADNEEKAQRWFSKLSQMGSNSDMSNTIDDDDFPEIMPLRKGTNRFVLSRRKSPLERRLANSGQYELNSGTKNYQVGENPSFDPVGDTSSSVKFEKAGDFENQHTNTRSWDSGNTRRTSNDYASASNGSQAWNPQPLWENSSKSGVADTSASNGSQAWNPQPLWGNSSRNGIADTGMRTTGQSFQNTYENQTRTALSKGFPVPDQGNARFAGNVLPPAIEYPYSNSYNVGTNRNGCPNDGHETRVGGISSQNSYYNSQASANTSWSNGYPYNASSVATGSQNFENSSSNFNNPHWDHEYSHQGNSRINDTGTKVVGDWSQSSYNPQPAGSRSWDNSHTIHQNETNPANMRRVSGNSLGNPYDGSTKAWNDGSSGNLNASGVSNSFGGSSNQLFDRRNTSYTIHQNETSTANMGRVSRNLPENRYNAPNGGWNVGFSGVNTSGVSNSFVGSSNQPLDSKNNSYTIHQNQNMERVSGNWSENHYNAPTRAWNTSGVSNNSVVRSHQPFDSNNNGTSLEGSGVREADALDMSEEAKAERWFKRVANIKDISELSQIPDEDFPSIMPMRKGVNRFVVSKRKTPLERRLTSQQSRRNVPSVNSYLEKKEDDEI